MGNRYLVVSDLHVVDQEDHPDGWKAYKSSRFVFDEEFAELVDQFMEQGDDGDQLTLILNGDVFDFDLVTACPDDPPWPVSRAERRRGMNPTAAKSAWKLQHILSFHRELTCVLARFVSAGHKLVYILGNHDRELHFPEVQKTFIDALEGCAQAAGISMAQGTVLFEPWFYYVPGVIYVEHGHQYDNYNSYRYLLSPVMPSREGEVLALPMGNLSNRYLLSRMGFFNPHASDFILNVFAYIMHWLRHYAFSRRSIALNWMWGSLLVAGQLLRNRRTLRYPPPEHLKRMSRVARRYDLSVEEVQALGQLQRRPITSRVYRMLRELWLDRVIIALIMIGGTVALALVPIPLWIKLMVPLTAFPLLFLIYERLAQGETIFTIETENPRRARAIAHVLPARLIVFGHTHKPRLIPLGRGVSFADTGTWAPVMDAGLGGVKLAPGLRNYLHVSSHKQEVTFELESWQASTEAVARRLEQMREADGEAASSAKRRVNA